MFKTDNNNLPPVFLSMDDCLQHLFNERTSLNEMMVELVGKEKAKSITPELLGVGLGASYMTGTATQDSDLDFDIQVRSLPELKRILEELGIDHIYRVYDPSVKILGFHNHVMIYPGFFRKIKVEINAEEYPIEQQRLIILTKFVSKYFLDNPEEHKKALELKRMAHEGINGGFRKSVALIYTEIMKKEFGEVPQRFESDVLERKSLIWDGNVDPFDWMYLRECFGVDKAKEITRKLNKLGAKFLQMKNGKIIKD